LPDIQKTVNALQERIADWMSKTLLAGWQALLPFIPVLVATAALLLFVVVVGIVSRLHREHIFHGATLRSIDVMDGTEFEMFLATLFSHLGYRVERVGMSHDFGADLLLTSRRNKRIVVQAKRYASNVGIGAVQEVLGAVRYYNGARGMVVTNRDFTESAQELAARSGVELWNRNRLVAAMSRIRNGRHRGPGSKSAYNRQEE